jgi:hypothetical protein
MFYDEIPTRADLADCKIILKNNKLLNDDYNYIVIDKKEKTAKYYLNNYKTKSTYGEKIINLSNKLYEILTVYMKKVEKFTDDNWLLLNDKLEKMNRQQLGLLYSSLGNYVNKNLSLTNNRHIKISSVVPVKQMKDLSNVMSHSINEQIFVYAKE